mmetsp:Transcript_73997/g.149092  ORF Transcript_73997/g.149092 Transcript_73997/m.149092 type:complete len:214 (-) Transcript_73997:283-924(-)
MGPRLQFFSPFLLLLLLRWRRRRQEGVCHGLHRAHRRRTSVQAPRKVFVANARLQQRGVLVVAQASCVSALFVGRGGVTRARRPTVEAPWRRRKQLGGQGQRRRRQRQQQPWRGQTRPPKGDALVLERAAAVFEPHRIGRRAEGGRLLAAHYFKRAAAGRAFHQPQGAAVVALQAWLFERFGAQVRGRQAAAVGRGGEEGSRGGGGGARQKGQ